MIDTCPEYHLSTPATISTDSQAAQATHPQILKWHKLHINRVSSSTSYTSTSGTSYISFSLSNSLWVIASSQNLDMHNMQEDVPHPCIHLGMHTRKMWEKIVANSSYKTNDGRRRWAETPLKMLTEVIYTPLVAWKDSHLGSWYPGRRLLLDMVSLAMKKNNSRTSILSPH